MGKQIHLLVLFIRDKSLGRAYAVYFDSFGGFNRHNRCCNSFAVHYFNKCPLSFCQLYFKNIPFHVSSGVSPVNVTAVAMAASA